MHASLVDQYCAEPHSGAISAAVCDPQSGATVTADDWGTVSITRPNERNPAFIYTMEAAVYAVAISAGGALFVVEGTPFVESAPMRAVEGSAGARWR